MYVYEPLSDDQDPDAPYIRLLLLLPGERDSPIHCRLIRATLKDSPFFEALSYVWGKPGETTQIQLHGSNFQATLNLENALRHLRYKNRQRCLWVDAVCINQSDNAEKSSQVILMPDIYSQAAQVLFWLGQADEHSDVTCDMISQWYHEALKKAKHEDKNTDSTAIAKKTEIFSMPAEDKEGSKEDIPDECSAERSTDAPRNADAQVSPSATELDRLEAIFSRPWWSRLWVVQEGAYAGGGWFICGHHSFPFDPAVLYIALNRRVPPSDLEGRLRLQRLIRPLMVLDEVGLSRKFGGGHVRRNNLQEAIEAFSERNCSNPRDRVYAILSLLRPFNYPIRPDYKKSVAEVFQEATRLMISQSKRLDSLLALQPQERYANRENEEKDKDPARRVPSWVPDWHSRPNSSHPIEAPFWGIGKINIPLYSADGRGHGMSVGENVFSHGPDVLRLNGLEIDQIANTTPKSTGGVPGAERRALRLFWKKARAKPSKYPMGEDLFDAFWITLIRCVPMNNPVNGWAPRLTTHHFLRYRKMLYRWLESFEDDSAMAESGNTPDCDCEGDTEALLKHIEKCWRNWTFCTSEKGFFALVHGDVMPRDYIFIVDGASMPLILRPDVYPDGDMGASTDGLRCFSRVGVAYVHGLMYKGEGRRYCRPLQKKESVLLV